jgi:bifunctional non-homologous end joining protein LigD
MKDPLAGLPEQARQRLVAAEQPSWTNPMLATLTDRRFSDPGWVFEPKFDGERCLAFRQGPQVRLLSRNRKRLNDHYPELAEALAAQEADDFVVDGEVVAFMLPHLRGRPVAMERYPDGIDGERIFQKDVPRHFPDWVDRVKVEKEHGSLQQVVCEDAATLVYLANQACITPHVWLSRADRPDHPDHLIFDLDPAGDEFEEARVAALWLRSLLEELELPSFPKTTGGKGLHLTVPLDRRTDFEEVRGFARDVAEELAGRHPDRLTTEQRKDRRKRRLYLDAMRNAYAQTAVPPYAVRARPGATVAAPLDWSEAEDRSLRPTRFTITSILDRLQRVDDPWKDLRRRGRSLSRARKRLAGLGEQGG